MNKVNKALQVFRHPAAACARAAAAAAAAGGFHRRHVPLASRRPFSAPFPAAGRCALCAAASSPCPQHPKLPLLRAAKLLQRRPLRLRPLQLAARRCELLQRQSVPLQRRFQLLLCAAQPRPLRGDKLLELRTRLWEGCVCA